MGPGLVLVLPHQISFSSTLFIVTVLGWKFAIWETQMVLIELISKFEFTLPEDGRKVYRRHAALMVPTIEGEQNNKPALFLDISVIRG
jgi:hypothetical protein